ncbi:hypothetical protein GCM10028857_15270 [Salinarchaeum chitinilyticum]
MSFEFATLLGIWQDWFWLDGYRDSRQLGSPRLLRSRDSLRSSLTPFAAVLASSCFPERSAPSNPTRSRFPEPDTWWGPNLLSWWSDSRLQLA